MSMSASGMDARTASSAFCLGVRAKFPILSLRPAFVDVSSVEGQTLRPAACRVDRPDFFERGPGALVAGGLLRLAWLAVCHVVVL